VASLQSQNTVIDTDIRTFIRALAHIGTYLGEVTQLFDSVGGSRALLDAAERRWDNHGSYKWQLPPLLAKELQVELASEGAWNVTADSNMQEGMNEQCLNVHPGLESRHATCENTTRSMIHLNGELNLLLQIDLSDIMEQKTIVPIALIVGLKLKKKSVGVL
jgi:hypothetical protein